jgi:hypothetical protein
MWRQAGFPIALSSQVPGHPSPVWCSSLLGNHVFRNFLGYTFRNSSDTAQYSSKPLGFPAEAQDCHLDRRISLPGDNPIAADTAGISQCRKLRVTLRIQSPRLCSDSSGD